MFFAAAAPRTIFIDYPCSCNWVLASLISSVSRETSPKAVLSCKEEDLLQFYKQNRSVGKVLICLCKHVLVFGSDLLLLFDLSASLAFSKYHFNAPRITSSMVKFSDLHASYKISFVNWENTSQSFPPSTYYA